MGAGAAAAREARETMATENFILEVVRRYVLLS